VSLLEQAIAVTALVGTIAGGVLYVAPQSDLDELDMRLSQHINADHAKAALQRIWQLEAKYGGHSCCEGWAQEDIEKWKKAMSEYEKAERGEG